MKWTFSSIYRKYYRKKIGESFKDRITFSIQVEDLYTYISYLVSYVILIFKYLFNE